jgi:hypothetical protein
MCTYEVLFCLLFLDLENQNDDATNDQDSFFIDSASRTFTELINVPLPHTQAFSPSANIPFSNSTSINTSTLPSVHLSSVPSPIDSSGPRILTPETVAKAIYNQLLNDKLSPILPSSKPTSSRIRKERKFGEVVTSDSFLQEIKQKTQKKLMKPRVNKSNVTKAKATSIKQKKKK